MPMKDGGPTAAVVRTQYLASKFIFSFRPIRRKIARIGEVAEYLDWVDTTFPGNAVLHSRRERLWKAIHASLAPNSIRGFEFGVAWGYATEWWLREVPQISRWDGFDRFSGLPRAWRQLPAGTFSTEDGLPPEISDPRVFWSVGNIEDTISTLDTSRKLNEKWVVLFDLDLFEPSLAAWTAITGSLRTGDVIYFDEAFDREERHLIVHSVLKQHDFTVIGLTPLALALRVM